MNAASAVAPVEPAIDDAQSRTNAADIADATTAPDTKPLSATQLKKLARKQRGGTTPALDANGERLYARKVKPEFVPKQKLRRDLIADQNPRRLNLRRWGHTCHTVPPSLTVPHERLVAFSGWGADFVPQGRTIDHRLNSLAVFDPRNGLFWHQPETTGVCPSAREQHASVLIPAASLDATVPAVSSSSPSVFSSLTCRSPHLLVFGGRSNPAHAASDLALLNLDTYEWLALPPAELGADVDAASIARFRHTAVWSRHRVIVYGGCRYESHTTAASLGLNDGIAPPPAPCTVHTVCNDLLVLDTSVTPMRWERVTPVGYAAAQSISVTPTGPTSDLTSSSSNAASSQLPSLPHKHTHAAAVCETTRTMYVFGGYGELNYHRNPLDNQLYALSMDGALDEWRWSAVPLAGVPPPPLASCTLHVLSPRFLLVLGGVSSEDMYSLSSLWIVDLDAKMWSRPYVHAGPHTRFHPVLERTRARREQTEKLRREAARQQGTEAVAYLDALQIANETIAADDAAATATNDGAAEPVRIVSHVFACKHAAVQVASDFFTTPPSADSAVAAPVVASFSPSRWTLLLCGGGGNVFHFNPFFNPTLRFDIRTRDAAGTDAAPIEIFVSDLQHDDDQALGNAGANAGVNAHK